MKQQSFTNKNKQISPSSVQYIYPKSQTQLNSLLQDYQQLTLEVKTLQRHILKIQTESQMQHKHFNDEIEKLKLYIDQCQNQIRKREQRELLLIQRLKQLQTQKSQELEGLKSSRNFLKSSEDLKEQFHVFLKSRQLEWSLEKQSLIDNNHDLVRANVDLMKRINQNNQTLNCLIQEKQSLVEKVEELMSQLASSQSTIIKLKHDIQDSKKNAQLLKEQNFNLYDRIKQSEMALNLKDIQKPQPISISSACPNCLRLSKLHQIQIQNYIDDIECLKKDVECLMCFFEIPD